MSIKSFFRDTHTKIINNELAKSTIKNLSWLVIYRVFTMVIGVFVTALVARNFGPELYGKFNYALSFVVLFSAFSTLGLETLAVKALIDKEYDEGTILFTSFLMRLFGGIILIIMTYLLIIIIEPNDKSLHYLVVILSLSMVFKSFEVIEYWIEAHQKAKLSSIIRMISYVIFAILRIILVIWGGTLFQLSFIYLVNTIIIGIGLSFGYFINKKYKIKWKISINFAKNMLRKSSFIILSGLMVTIYMQIDKVMLGALMASNSEVGIYSVAVSVSQMWYFVPIAVITSFKPVVMKAKKESAYSYKKSLRIMYSIITWIGIIFGFFIMLFSAPIVNVLFGADYSRAANVLSVTVWSGTFALLGTASSIWMINEGLIKYSTIFIFFGAAINVILNVILIPVIGGYGAAIATLVTQVSVNIIIPFIFVKTRQNTIIILKSFIFK